jgi:hypothetical protein
VVPPPTVRFDLDEEWMKAHPIEPGQISTWIDVRKTNKQNTPDDLQIAFHIT